MNHSETAMVLTLAAAYDRRTIGEADVEAWQDVLRDVDHADAMQAVKNHFANSRDYVMPIDVKQGVAAIRRERIDRLEDRLVPPPDLDEPGYRAWLKEARKALADGTYVPPEPDPTLKQRDIRGLIEAALAGRAVEGGDDDA